MEERSNDLPENVAATESSIRRYIHEGYKRQEIVTLLKQDFPDMNWSLSTLKRRMQIFGLTICDRNIPDPYVDAAVVEVLDGPSKNYGYRALTKRIRTEFGIKPPRHQVYEALKRQDPEGLKKRRPGRRKVSHDKTFTSPGPDHILSADGHDKLQGLYRNTFPIAIYGIIDTFSRRIMVMKVVMNNRDPVIVGKIFMDFLKETNICPRFLRVDRGSETDLMVTIHGTVKDAIIKSATDVAASSLVMPAATSSKSNEELLEDTGENILLWSADTNHVKYGSSVYNITIERFWRKVNEFIGTFFKPQLEKLTTDNNYDSAEELDRTILAYLYIPVIQKEIDKFIYEYNSHRIRVQKGVKLPTGCHPDFCYRLPEQFGARKCGVPIPDHILIDVEKSWKLDEVETDVRIQDPILLNIVRQFASNPLDIGLQDLPNVFKAIKKAIDDDIMSGR